ncbi:hypothetical protein ACA910_002606 [Epithemia clementina (nom. ined.)]
MERFTLGPDAFDRAGGMEFATKQFRTYKDTLKILSITLREPGQLRSDATMSLLRSVKQISGLKKIGLSNVNLMGAALGMAWKDLVLQWSRTLQEVRVSCCLVDQEFVEHAGLALASLGNLKVLVFANCNMWNETYFGTVIQQIAPPIALTELCLSSCGLTAASFSLLSKTFYKHKQIACLNLSGNTDLFKCDQNYSTIFFDGLISLQELQSLYIHQCGIDVLGSIAVFRAVEKMPRLARLMVNDNNFSLDASEGWVQSLPNITGLTTLWVGKQLCPPSATEVDAICDVLRRNISLTNLNVSGCPPRLHTVIWTVSARNKCIHRARLLSRTLESLPIAMLPILFSSLKQLDGEASAQHMMVRASLERWVSYSGFSEEGEGAWCELAP